MTVPFPSTQNLAKPRRHAEWTAVKKKHSAAIKTRKIVFDEKLGAALDKLSEHETKMLKLERASTLKVSDWEAHLKLYVPVAGLVTSYLTKIKGMGNPAETELRTALNDLSADNKAWEAARAKLVQARALVKPALNAASRLHDDLQSLTTRTPAAIYEITGLVKAAKTVIADLNTKDGKATAEVQAIGPSALFELNLVTERLKAALAAAASIEKMGLEVAGDLAFDKFKDSARLLKSRGLDPIADPLTVLTNTRLTLEKSAQINGIKTYADTYVKNLADLDKALRALG